MQPTFKMLYRNADSLLVGFEVASTEDVCLSGSISAVMWVFSFSWRVRVNNSTFPFPQFYRK